MNKLSRKLLVSLLLLIFSVFALGTATFAWFSLSDTATVSQFDANISSSEGIEVSLGDSNQNSIPTFQLMPLITF